MPTYSYRCVVCGPFDLVRPMSASGSAARCPACDRAGSRVFGAPALRSLSSGLRRALDADARSADSPNVLSTVPAAGRRSGSATRYTTDPRHARLPRP